MKRVYVDSIIGQIHYRMGGGGAALLLLHQTPSSSSEYGELMSHLARDFRVIALDTPGYGMSDPPPRAFQITDYANVVREFLSALGISRTHLFGHHTGASIAVEVAAAYPELVDRLVLSGCPSYTAEERDQKIASVNKVKIAKDGKHISGLWDSLSQRNPEITAADLHQRYIDTLLAGERAEEAHLAVFSYDAIARLPELRCPVLSVHGTGDTFFPKREVTANLINNCHSVVIEATNPVTVKAPGKLAQVMSEFLNAG